MSPIIFQLIYRIISTQQFHYFSCLKITVVTVTVMLYFDTSVSPAHNEYANVISAEESGQWIFYRYVLFNKIYQLTY